MFVYCPTVTKWKTISCTSYTHVLPHINFWPKIFCLVLCGTNSSRPVANNLYNYFQKQNHIPVCSIPLWILLVTGYCQHLYPMKMQLQTKKYCILWWISLSCMCSVVWFVYMCNCVLLSANNIYWHNSSLRLWKQSKTSTRERNYCVPSDECQTT